MQLIGSQQPGGQIAHQLVVLIGLGEENNTMVTPLKFISYGPPPVNANFTATAMSARKR